MGGASRADRYRLLVVESGVEGVGAGSGSCQTIRFIILPKYKTLPYGLQDLCRERR
jgi:hypothetical protein